MTGSFPSDTESQIAACLEHLIEAPERNPLRLWVPQCGDGMAAYVLAARALTMLAARQRGPQVQVFATDLDDDAIARARTGRLSAPLPPEVLPGLCQESDAGILATDRLRSLITFAVHDVFHGAPFPRLDLIAATGLPSVTVPEHRRNLVSRFHFAMRAGGFLLVADDDLLEDSGDLFTPQGPGLYAHRPGGVPRGGTPAPLAAASERSGPGAAARRLLLEHFTPPAVLVDQRLWIRHFQGRLRDWVAAPTAGVSLRLDDLLHPAWRQPVMDLLKEARRGGRRCQTIVKDGEDLLAFNVLPTLLAGERAFLITFQGLEHGGGDKAQIDRNQESEEAAQILSEELLTTNEELSQSREQLQTINDELAATNAELTARLADLEEARNDIGNLLAHVDMAVVMIDSHGRVRRATRAAEVLLGQNAIPDNVPLADLDLGPAGADLPARVAEAITDYSSHETEVLGSDGQWYLRRIQPSHDPVHRIRGAVVTFANVSAMKRAEAAVRESEARYRAILDNMTDTYYRTDPDGRLAMVSPSIQTLLGQEPDQVIGRPLTDLFLDPGEHEALTQLLAIQGGRVTDFETRWRHRDGHGVWISVNARRLVGGIRPGEAIEGTLRDISERKRLEDSLRHAQKMEAIGNLTGGVAHEFNNLLQVVIANLDMAAQAGADSQRLARCLKLARTASERGADITRRLNAFARHEQLQVSLAALPPLVSEIVDMVRQTLPRTITVELEINAQPMVSTDTIHLQQALLNLALNARDAMEDGGTLTFRVISRHLPPEEANGFSVTPGHYGAIRVVDTGTGIDPKTAAHVFEPFFTTKRPGQGTGLGLSQVYGFVRQSDGFITLDSQPGAGTTVTLYLPEVR